MAADGAFVVAADSSSSRTYLLQGNIDRLGAACVVVGADGGEPPFAPASFDRVLLDAPCSGLGALRRRPDARWRIQPHDIDDLALLQSRILAAVAPLVRVGGTLVYSVCTITAAESVDHPTPAGFDVVADPPPGQWRPYRQGWRVLPQDDDTDAMVMIRYRRTHD
jgi:16S rRNA (cytosine967-C5)-methyltransferase